MRHRKKIAKLGRTAEHRKAMLRNMAVEFLRRERIRTTRQKARALRRYVEKLITRARVDSLHNKRIVESKLKDRRILVKLFNDIAPRYKERPGGYTRIYKLGTRPGDAAEMVIMELVEEEIVAKPKKKKKSDASRSGTKGKAKAKADDAGTVKQKDEAAADTEVATGPDPEKKSAEKKEDAAETKTGEADSK